MINTKFKKWAVRQSIHHPKRTIASTLIITLIMGFGLKHFVIEDDMMKMIPKSVKTRVVWEEVKGGMLGAMHPTYPPEFSAP